MVNKYYQKHKERLRKEHVKVKGEKRSEIGIKIFLKKENKTNVSIRKNII